MPPPPQGTDPDPGEVKEAVLDGTQMALDLAGIVDQTGASDFVNAAISVWRRQWWDAGIGIIAMVPLGDFAKFPKFAQYPKKIGRMISLAGTGAGKAIKPVLKQLDNVIQRIPLNRLPAAIRKPLENIKGQLDNLFRGAGAGSKAAGDAFAGLTNRQIVQSLSTEQLDLLRQWMGTGAQGAEQALGRALPEGLTADTLRAYQEIARRQIAAGLDTVGTQAARLQLIEQGLRSLGQ